MAVNVPTAADFATNVARALVNVRNDFDQIINLNDYIAAMGGATFLTAAAPNGLGMTQADANAMVATLGNHATIAKHYKGGTPAPAMDYRSNGSPFWGGQ
jgi:hypothetical protein